MREEFASVVVEEELRLWDSGLNIAFSRTWLANEKPPNELGIWV